jgi:hypothetical protein
MSTAALYRSVDHIENLVPIEARRSIMYSKGATYVTKRLSSAVWQL